MQKHEQKTCPLGDDIVSYMYDEMSTAGQLEFERHLAACEACTDDFAAVSLARFETYDWKRIEFDPLATPQIVIPYSRETVTFGERISAWMSWTTVAPVSAAVVACLSVGYLLLISSGPKTGDTLADHPQVAQPQPPSSPAPRVYPPASSTEVASNGSKNVNSAIIHRVSVKRAPQVSVSQIARRQSPSVKLANDVADNIQPSQLRPAPRLGMKDEEDDRSLRLADLFDETNPPPQR